MTPRAERLLKGIADTQQIQIDTLAEAILIRKIAADLIAKAAKLEETASYHDRQIADWQAMLRDEEERS